VRTRSIWNLLRIASNAVSGIESEFCCRRNSSYVETQLAAVEAVVSFSRFAPVRPNRLLKFDGFAEPLVEFI
jgi:hypothetical protein